MASVSFTNSLTGAEYLKFTYILRRSQYFVESLHMSSDMQKTSKLHTTVRSSKKGIDTVSGTVSGISGVSGILEF